ncbi:MAG: dprA [Acidimicrobiales bacterium]|nr:dprA [Acidimicrobiales bacterium]
MTPVSQPPEAYAAAVAALPGMWWGKLAQALSTSSPEAAWSRIGDPRVDVAAVWDAYVRAGVAVCLHGGPGYPQALVEDHQAPSVLFSRGDMCAVDGPRVAIVGSRRCTRYGRDVAFDMGRDLAQAGVRVVSGLALGIDGAAHLGALAAGDGAAPPVAVVGSGLDVVYPRAHARLWDQVAEAGVLVSEAPLGARPEPWRFPARNRILAALADVVVVVESRAQGGSRHTVDAAEARDVTVMAVPGPVRSSSSAFTNELLHVGVGPARDAADVLVTLSLQGHMVRMAKEAVRGVSQPDDPDEAAVLAALGWQPVSLGELVGRTGFTPSRASVALARLEVGGWVAGGGGWWEQVRREAPAK